MLNLNVTWAFAWCSYRHLHLSWLACPCTNLVGAAHIVRFSLQNFRSYYAKEISKRILVFVDRVSISTLRLIFALLMYDAWQDLSYLPSLAIRSTVRNTGSSSSSLLAPTADLMILQNLSGSKITNVNIYMQSFITIISANICSKNKLFNGWNLCFS